MENKTLRGVIWHKIVDLIDTLALSSLIRYFSLVFFAGILSSAFFDGGAMIQALAEWRGGAIPNTVLCFALVLNAPRFLRLVVSAVGESSVAPEQAYQGGAIEGIPTGVLLDHLFTEKTFKRAEIEQKFRVPRYKYSELSRALRDLGVLTSGENNATILAPGLRRAEVARMLEGKTSAEDLKPGINIVRYPSQSPSPAPSFVRRTLAQTA